MKITLTVNGKQIDAEVDEKEIREACKGKTGYETCWDGYFINNEGKAEPIYSQSISACEESDIYKTGNYYSNKSVAENNARADALMRKLRRFAAEHGGCVSQKTNVTQGYIYHIWWDNVQKQPTWMGNDRQLCGAIAFDSKDDTIEAIKEFYTELVWYFTEYDPMPEGWWDS